MNPNNYGSLPACKKLVEVLAKKGIAIKTEFCWYGDGTNFCIDIKGKDYIRGVYGYDSKNDSCIPTYSMAEVWRELPEVIISDKLEYYKTIMSGATVGEAYCGYFNQGKRQWLWGFCNPNPTDALIELWIRVLKQGGKG